MVGRSRWLCAIACLLLYSAISCSGAAAPAPTETEASTRAAVADIIAAASQDEAEDGATPSLPPVSSPPPLSLASGALGMALKLALVLALAYGASLALRRLGPRGRGRPGAPVDCLAVLGSLTLGQGRVIYVVGVGAKRLLIGATGQQLSLLGDVTADLAEAARLEDPARQGER